MSKNKEPLSIKICTKSGEIIYLNSIIKYMAKKTNRDVPDACHLLGKQMGFIASKFDEHDVKVLESFIRDVLVNCLAYGRLNKEMKVSLVPVEKNVGKVEDKPNNSLGYIG